MSATDDFKEYVAFISRHGQDRFLMERLLKETAPFRRYSLERNYPLVAASEVDMAAVSRAIALVFGLGAVKRVIPVSAGDGDRSAAAFDDCAFVPLSLKVRQERLMDIRAALPKSVSTRLVSVSYGGLGGDDLGGLLSHQYEPFFEAAPREVEVAGMFSPFIAHFFLGLYAVIGQRDDFFRMTGLLRLQRHAILLGENGESPGEWYLLVR